MKGGQIFEFHYRVLAIKGFSVSGPQSACDDGHTIRNESNNNGN